MLLKSGYMDSISLTASYDFTAEEQLRAAPGSRADRTVRHETMHAAQTLATSYGYHYLLMRTFQASRTLQMIKLLGEAGRELELPLIRQVARLRPVERLQGDSLRALHVVRGRGGHNLL